MKAKPLLIVDDEESVRVTLARALEPTNMRVETAVNGEEALAKLEREEFGIVLLDLRMPGMDGMKVLRLIRERWPSVRVVIITAYGTVESAVEAMKLGAADFVQKPFSPKEIQELVEEVLEREALDEPSATDYHWLTRLAKRCIGDDRLDDAKRFIQQAIAQDPAQSEAYNLMGVLSEMRGDLLEAERFFRAALDMDPTYEPARENLQRTAAHRDTPETPSSDEHGEKIEE